MGQSDTQAAPLLAATGWAPPGCAYGFSTRAGGRSQGPLSSLNLALRPGEDPEHLAQNWRMAVSGLGQDFHADRLVLMSQVHGGEVAVVEAPSGWSTTIGEFDAAVTAVPGLVLAVRTADCVPVLFAAAGAIGVAHAGWRGAAAGVIPNTLHALRTLSAGPITATIGPAISGPAYEVGPEVVAGLEASGVNPDVFVVARRGDRSDVDVGAAVEAQLRVGGVEGVQRIRRCTRLDPAFFSHRENPACGRQAGLIALFPR